MIALWYVEAGKYKVFPLDSRGTHASPTNGPSSARTQIYVYYPDTQTVPENVAVKVLNRAHSLTAEVEIPKGGARRAGLPRQQRRRLHAVRQRQQAALRPQLCGAQEFRVESSDRAGRQIELRYEFEPTGKPDIAKGKGTPGHAQLYINGKLVGERDLPFTMPLLLGLGGGLTVGRNPGSSVSQLYAPPFAFTGTIFKVTADVSGKMLQDTEEERKAMAKARWRGNKGVSEIKVSQAKPPQDQGKALAAALSLS